MKKAPSAFVILAGCVAVSLFAGCAGPKGFSVRAPEKPVLNYAGIPYDEAWKDLVAFMEGDAKWCMGSIEDMSKTDGYVRTSWRTSNNVMTPYQTRVMARFNDARDRVEFTPEALFQTVPGFSTEIAEHLKVAIRLHDSKKALQRSKQRLEHVNKTLAEAPPERKLQPESAEDKVIIQRLVGTWKSSITGESTIQMTGKSADRSTWKNETTYEIRADGTIAETAVTVIPAKTITTRAAGTWTVRGNRFFYRRDMQGTNGQSIKSDTALLMIWKDADSWEMRDDPTDEISIARNKALGNNTIITYDADGTQHTVTESNGITINGSSTPCVFKRVSLRESR